MTRSDLQQWLGAFVGGRDVSKTAAGRIEGGLVELFPEDDMCLELADQLAQYQPGGGDYLFGYEDVLPRCREILVRLRSGSAQE